MKPDKKKSMDNLQSSQFADIYRRHFRPLYSYIAYRVTDRPAAEDITSQVFEKAWNAFAGFDPSRASASTWLFAIARNTVSDYFRKQKRDNKSVLDQNAVSSSFSNPEQIFESGELLKDLSSALSFLSSREHEVLSLKFGASMTNRDIGKLLDISESNVGTILYRSLGKLKKQLEGGN